MDDDIVIDFVRIFQQFMATDNKELDSEFDNSLVGYIQMGLPVQRNVGWKWVLSKQEYDNDIHPNFLSGWAYLTTPNVARKLVNISKQTSLLWIDDVWITGILAAEANVELKSLNRFYTFYKEHIQCCVEDPILECDFLVGPSENNPNVIRQFGEHSRNCWKHIYADSERTRIKSLEPLCKKRVEKEAIIKNCNVPNPYFFPDSRGIGEVF